MCPRSVFNPSDASQSPSVRPTTPTASSTRSASNTSLLLSSALPPTNGATVTLTPVAVFSTAVVVVEVRNFIPRFVYRRCNATETSLSSTGRIRSIISTTVTSVPIEW